MRVLVAISLLVLTLSACGTSDESASNSAGARVERCVDRLLENARNDDTSEETLRRYARETYCIRFEDRRWIYDDGALRIAAQRWLEEGGTCATARPGEPAETVPCKEERSAGARQLECALLRHVRRSEAIAYLQRLQRKGEVECADGTPLDELGVP